MDKHPFFIFQKGKFSDKKDFLNLAPVMRHF